MSSKKINVKGITVEMWKASFRVEGMSDVIFPAHITEDNVRAFVEAMYVAIEKKATEEARRKVAREVGNRIAGLLG